eukprot:scaffold7245_cov197-Ochromonas_danica.AAC.14
MNKLGDHTFITVVIGDCFHVYNMDKLAVTLVSRAASGAISHIQAYLQSTFAAVGNLIHVYFRTKIVKTLDYHQASIAGLLAVGKLLISYDESNRVVVYDSKDRKVVSDFQILRESQIRAVYHPATYLNKLVFGFEDGGLELWNIRTQKLLHTFRALDKHLARPSAVSAIDQSPACDVIAVGLASGDIFFVNLKLDIALFHFKQKGAVTSLSFRSDVMVDGSPYLASGSVTGSISFWQIGGEADQDNEQRGRGRLLTSLAQAHNGAVRRLAFAQGEPLLITTGEDNSIKVWIFDTSTGPCRLLRSRQGFATCPRRIRCYYGSANGNTDYDNGEEIFCAEGKGVLRAARSSAPHLLQEFSRAALVGHSILPDCLDFDFSSAPHEWGTLASIHANCSSTYLWNLRDKAVVKTLLVRSEADARKDRGAAQHPRGASALCVTACGHYCVIGYRDGAIILFNMQSGLQRGTFPGSTDMEFDDSYSSLHQGKITGLSVDLRNAVMVSCGLDGRLVFWNFSTHTVLLEQRFQHPLLLLRAMPDTGLVAVADERSSIRIFDLNSFRLVRVFPPAHETLMSDLTFSADGRRLLSAARDGTLRVWEISTARCLNYILFPHPITALAVARNGDLLVAEEGCRFVRMCYDASLTQAVPLWREPLHPTLLLAPPSLIENKPIGEDNAEDLDLVRAAQQRVARYHDARLQESALATSDLPRLLWSTLFRRQTGGNETDLKMPVVRETVPFYLQAAADVSGKIVFQDKGSDEKKEDSKEADVPKTGSRLLSKQKGRKALSLHSGRLVRVLESLWGESDQRDEALAAVLGLIRQSSPQQCENEIRGLCKHDEDIEGMNLLRRFLSLLAVLVQRGKAFEIVQAYVHFTLSVHHQVIVSNYSMKEEVEALQAALFAREEELRGQVSATLCYLKTMLGVPLI